MGQILFAFTLYICGTFTSSKVQIQLLYKGIPVDSGILYGVYTELIHRTVHTNEPNRRTLRDKLLPMRQCFYTLCAVFLLLPVFVVRADEPCGSITAPAGWDGYFDPTETLVTTPITDCTYPFGLLAAPEPLQTFYITGQAVENGSTVLIDGEETDDYSIRYAYLPNTAFSIVLFRHSGSDYEYVSLDELPITEADYRALAAEFFTDPADIDIYVARLMSDDPWSGLEYGSEESDTVDDFDRYVRINFEPRNPPLALGTYTLVFKSSKIIQTNSNGSWWGRLYRFFLPAVVYAETPPDPNTYTLTFTIANATPEPTGASSVLFLPGIQASRLYTRGLLGSEDQLWEANNNDDVRELAMTTNGVSTKEVYTRDIAGEAYGIVDIYAGFSQYMDTLVTNDVIKDWTPFAYDWRYSVTDIVGGTKYEDENREVIKEIDRLASSSFSGKVTLIGHSNGGLLAKAIMIRLAEQGKTSLIDTVVLLASPQFGTPKAIASILHGYDQELGKGYVVDDVVARESMKNMPGVYGLIPTADYFAVATSTVVKFEASTSTELFRTAYGDTIDSLTELTNFMTGTGDGRPEAVTVDEVMRVNGTTLQNALDLHNNLLDNWEAPLGVKVVEIVGVGLDTISGFEYRGFTERVCDFLIIFSCSMKNLYKPVPQFSTYGDKTVMGESAGGYSGNKEQYFIDLEASDIEGGLFSVEHFNITENPSIQALVKNVLEKATTSIEFISSGPNTLVPNRLLFGSHSPVTLEVTDTVGRKVGRGTVGGISIGVEDIPSSSYFELGSSTYIIVPDGVQYEVKMKGIGEGGLTFSLDTLKGNVQTPLVSVRVATITPSSTVSVAYSANTLSNIAVDQNGDGITDQVLTPQGLDVTPVVTYATLREAIQKLPLSNARKAPLLLLVATAEALDKNPKLKALETVTLNQLEALLVTYEKKKWISASDLANLKGIISKLK